MRKRSTSRFKNVRIITDTSRKNGVRYDRYFLIRYKLAGKDFEEGFGWESEGFTEKAAFDMVCQIKQNIKTGQGFFSLKEKREAEEKKRQEIEKRIEENKKENITIDEFFENTYKPFGMPDIDEKTRTGYINMYYNHIKPVIGTKTFKEVTALDIEKLKNSKLIPEDESTVSLDIDKSKLLTPSTVDKIIGVIRKMYRKAEEFDVYYGKWPTRNVKVPKRDNRRLRYFKENEEELLLNRLKQIETREHYFGYEYYNKNKISQPYEISLLAFDTGIRANEIFSLKVMDIDLDTKIISILNPKNGEIRFVPMTNRVFDMLKSHIEGISGLKKDSYLFQTQFGKKIKQMTKQFQKIVDELGFNDNLSDKRYKAVFHNLRHTFISQMMQKGVQEKATQLIVGHKTACMTERYTHFSPENLKAAINVLN